MSARLRDERASERQRMVEQQIQARGVQGTRVVRAMRTVRREGYVPSYLGEFAYDDTPLPIEEEQTISQPYIVAFMLDALQLEGTERVLEIGTGSGYAAAVLAEIVDEVYTVERHARLARAAAARLARDGYVNVHVLHGDGTLGCPQHAPFDAIVVAAGGPKVPESLRDQLAIGGRLVIPVGESIGLQKLRRVTRLDATHFREEELADVRFVPLIGEQGWQSEAPRPASPVIRSLSGQVAQEAEGFASLDSADLEPLLRRIGDARVVLLGESTHGTSEFYRMRARITRELVRRKGFRIVAVEADWPDAASIDQHVRGRGAPRREWRAFARFPAWMWRNRDVRDFVAWLHDHNRHLDPGQRVRFAGLDLYGLFHSIDAVLEHLERTDPPTAALARQRYGCLTPWQREPAEYGRAALTPAFRSCEPAVASVLQGLLAKTLEGLRRSDEELFDALQHARVVAEAEAYYRKLYRGSAESWNLRDRHMFATLRHLLDFHGPRARAVVWAHNSHVGDAAATDMATRGELNIGQLCRRDFGAAAYSIGFGTHEGTVAAAAHWGAPMEVMRVLPSLDGSHERLFHESGVAGFFLPLRSARAPDLRRALSGPWLQRAIGVIYRPETERSSHYFHATLTRQFDEFIWFDRTEAVQPLETHEFSGMPDTYPFGL